MYFFCTSVSVMLKSPILPTVSFKSSPSLCIVVTAEFALNSLVLNILLATLAVETKGFTGASFLTLSVVTGSEGGGVSLVASAVILGAGTFISSTVFLLTFSGWLFASSLTSTPIT